MNNLQNRAETVNPHTKDADCTVDPETNVCTGCGAGHGDPCTSCRATGYHQPGCPELFDRGSALHEVAVLRQCSTELLSYVDDLREDLVNGSVKDLREVQTWCETTISNANTEYAHFLRPATSVEQMETIASTRTLSWNDREDLSFRVRQIARGDAQGIESRRPLSLDQLADVAVIHAFEVMRQKRGAEGTTFDPTVDSLTNKDRGRLFWAYISTVAGAVQS